MENNSLKKFLKAETIVGVIFFILSAIFLFEVRNVPAGFMQALGADVYPKAIAIALMIFSVFSIIKGIGKNISTENVSSSKINILEEWKKGEYKLPLIWLLMTIYILFIRSIGYFEMGFLFLTSSMIVLGEKNIKWYMKSVIISLLITFVSYIIFVKVLNVYLPSGIIFDL